MKSLKLSCMPIGETPAARAGCSHATGKAGVGVEYHPKRRSDVNFRNIEGEMVILDRQGGFVHQLNPTASLIWSCCDGESTIEEIADGVVEAYDVDLGTAMDDVRKVVAQFKDLGLLESNQNRGESDILVSEAVRTHKVKKSRKAMVGER